jgi:hypothetical protein
MIPTTIRLVGYLVARPLINLFHIIAPVAIRLGRLFLHFYVICFLTAILLVTFLVIDPAVEMWAWWGTSGPVPEPQPRGELVAW